MRRLGQVMQHVRLVQRMGQSVGVDVVAAHRAGDLTQADWARMVLRCQGCDCAELCQDWLRVAKPVAETPDTCPNRARFARLQVQQERRQ